MRLVGGGIPVLRGIPQPFPLSGMVDPAQRAAVAAPAGHRFTETIVPIEAMPEAARDAYVPGSHVGSRLVFANDI